MVKGLLEDGLFKVIHYILSVCYAVRDDSEEKTLKVHLELKVSY